MSVSISFSEKNGDNPHLPSEIFQVIITKKIKAIIMKTLESSPYYPLYTQVQYPILN